MKNGASKSCFLIAFLMAIGLSGCTLPAQSLSALPKKTFVSDGCSLWPDLDYVDCCVRHDRAYWQGGTAQQRKQADQQLRQCVSDKGRPFNASIMYIGTRIWGHGWLPTPFRWGFGYDWPQGYSQATNKAVVAD